MILKDKDVSRKRETKRGEITVLLLFIVKPREIVRDPKCLMVFRFFTTVILLKSPFSVPL